MPDEGKQKTANTALVDANATGKTAASVSSNNLGNFVRFLGGTVIHSIYVGGAFIARTAYNATYWLNMMARGKRIIVGIGAAVVVGMALSTMAVACFTALSSVGAGAGLLTIINFTTIPMALSELGSLALTAMPILDGAAAFLEIAQERGWITNVPSFVKTILEHEFISSTFKELMKSPIWLLLSNTVTTNAGYYLDKIIGSSGIAEIKNINALAASAGNSLSKLKEFITPSTNTIIGLGVVIGVAGLVMVIDHFFREEKKAEVKAEKPVEYKKFQSLYEIYSVMEDEAKNLISDSIEFKRVGVNVADIKDYPFTQDFSPNEIQNFNDFIAKYNERHPDKPFAKIESISLTVNNKMQIHDEISNKLNFELEGLKKNLEQIKSAKTGQDTLANFFKENIDLDDFGKDKAVAANILFELKRKLPSSKTKKNYEEQIRDLTTEIQDKEEEIKKFNDEIDKVKKENPESLKPKFTIKSKEPEKKNEKADVVLTK